jgi:predicted deacylase
MGLDEGEITCDIDFDRPGRQVSFLRLAHSDNVHAYGAIPVPIAVIKNGEGPTVLLTGGTHGDEYEGQVIVGRLIREIEPEAVKGRIILLPSLNYPAAKAGWRVSPLDGLNLNRSFPGDASGPPTRAIAHFVDSVLLPRCDAGIDLHSGGTLGEYLPCTFLCRHPDRDLMARMRAMVEAFAAPWVYVVEGASAPTGLDPVAQRRGVAFISTELAGGASIDRVALGIGLEGTRRMLAHLGVLPAAGKKPPGPLRWLRAVDHRDNVVSPVAGIFEPCCALGDEVGEGQPAGWVHCLEDPGRASTELVFERGGIVVSRRVPARVERGDYVFQVAEEIDPGEL